jgi:hypothetical protein
VKSGFRIVTGSCVGFLSDDPGEPEHYRKDVPDAEVHILDAVHFAIDTKADEIAALVCEFMKK